jgi:hypothetical protein
VNESEAISQAITSSVEVATRFLQHFLPAGEVFPGNGNGAVTFFKIGDFKNTPAKEKGPQGGSTYVRLPELCGNDRTTGDKVAGPVSIVRLLFGCDAPQAVERIRQWLESEGIDLETEAQARGRPRAEPYPWPAAVAGLNGANLLALENFRGYSPELCRRIKDLELLARVDGHWCFAIYNRNGVVVGINQLVKHPYYDSRVARQQWVPKPMGVDRSVWLEIGAPLSTTRLVLICESGWDALAVLSLYSDEELKSTTILSSHGTGGDVMPRFGINVKRVILVVQNDPPSHRWAEKLAAQAGGYDLAVVLPPEPEKDSNDALRKGKLRREDFDKAQVHFIDPATGEIRIEVRPWYAMFDNQTESGPAVKEGVRLMAASHQLFEVGYISPTERGRLAWLYPDGDTVFLDKTEIDFNQIFQSFARTCVLVVTKKGIVRLSQPLTPRASKLLLKGWNRPPGPPMPRVDRILKYPTLLQNELGQLFVPSGPGFYSTPRGSIFVQSKGPVIPAMEFAQTKDVMVELTEEFRWAEESDRSRYSAVVLAEEMRSAGLLPGHCPFVLIDAPGINYGKTALAKRLFLSFGETPAMVMPVTGQVGVAHFEVLLSAAVARMQRFIFIDNFEGMLNSPALAAMLTNHRAQIRPTYAPEQDVSVAEILFVITSNFAAPTPELIDRACVIRLGQPPAWKAGVDQFARESQISADYARYTAARRSIIMHWDKLGRPRKEDRRHRFTEYFAPLCGLIEDVLGLTSPLDGVEAEAFWRTDVNAVWLRRLANFYQKDQPERPRGAADLEDDCRAHQMFPPNYRKGHDVHQLKQDIGLTLRSAASGRSEVDLGLFTATLTNVSTAKVGSKPARSAWKVSFKAK